MVANRRRVGFSSGALPLTITTINTFLCTSIPAIFIASSWRGSGRTHAKRLHTGHVLPPVLSPEWRDTDWFKTRVPDQTQKRPHFIQSANDLCRPRWIDRTRTDSTQFSSQWVGRRPIANSNPIRLKKSWGVQTRQARGHGQPDLLHIKPSMLPDTTGNPRES